MTNYRKEIVLSCIRYIEDKHFNSSISFVTSSEADTVTIDLGGFKVVVEKDELVKNVMDLTYDYYENN